MNATPPKPDNARSPLDLLRELPLSALPEVGPVRAAKLRGRNLFTMLDAILHLPVRYEDLRRRDDVANLQAGCEAIAEGVLINVAQRAMRGNRWRRITTAFLKQESGKGIRVVWFNLRGDGRMPQGEPLVLSGKVSEGRDGRLEIVHPAVYRAGSGLLLIRPVYRLPGEIPQRVFTNIVARGLDALKGEASAMPEALRTRAEVQGISEALRYVHRPPDVADIRKLNAGDTPAHRAFAMDELFVFQLTLARERARRGRRAGAALTGDGRLRSEFMARLPFRVTGAQTAAIKEIGSDLAAPTQMNRLLIGDVGSGKTLVAFDAILRAVESGWQAAMMAPTELLAEQHFAAFNRMCGRLGVLSCLLTSAVASSERARMLRSLARGDMQVVFGTQALIQKGIEIRRLGLAIIDEQHRFGVFDKARMQALGSEANVLMMTATPIPRSMALTIFRNLDVSVLDEMPPGRTAIESAVYGEDRIDEVDAIVKDEIERGNRAYYIAPLIEDGGDDRESVMSAAKRLSEGPLREFHVGVMHGRMRPAEKDRVMRDFRDGAVDVLVSTTVVEVGIDVADATIIVIRGADRYGLAQLHQLRGRVGRGPKPSRCCLVLSKDVSDSAAERVMALAKTRDGAEVARIDLELRGPGDLLGARQTGALPLRFAEFIRDYRLIGQAGELAEEWLRQDPELSSPESARILPAIERMLDFGFSLADVG